MNPIFESYLKYYENLTPETVEDLRQFATSDLHFADPFNEVRDVESVIEIFHDMFQRLKNPIFIVTDRAVAENKLFVRWEFQFSLWLLNFGKLQTITGVSIVRATAEGKIDEHIDYWDASTQIYMRLPLIGLLIRILRKAMG